MFLIDPLVKFFANKCQNKSDLISDTSNEIKVDCIEKMNDNVWNPLFIRDYQLRKQTMYDQKYESDFNEILWIIAKNLKKKVNDDNQFDDNHFNSYLNDSSQKNLHQAEDVISTDKNLQVN